MDPVVELHGAAIRAGFKLWYGWKPYGRHAAFLEGSQWWSRDRLESYQNNKLRQLVEHAYRNVPFYKQSFDSAGVKPNQVKTAKDLVDLPILSKKDIQDNRAALLARGADLKHLRENHTGGSTGAPLTLYQDDNYTAWALADLLRNYRMAGYELGMRWAFLWGSDYDATVHKGWRGKLKDRLVYNTMWINTFDLTRDTLVEAAKALVQWQPQMLVAYVASAVLLARLVRERRIRGLSPSSLQTSAEVLTADDRALLEETFECAVFDRYGCREVGNIAHECDAHMGLHVLMENNLVELVDEEGRAVKPGEVGRVVVTNLNNRAMPLIRYEIGDLAMATDRVCPCGRGLPLIGAVTGRKTDVIISPSGKLLHGEFFTHLFYKLDGVYQFRVVQETTSNLRIEIVPTREFNQAAALRFLEDTIHRHGDPAFHIQFDLRDHLAPSPSGKFRFTTSNVSLARISPAYANAV